MRKSSTKSWRPRSIGMTAGGLSRYGTRIGASEAGSIPRGGHSSGRRIPLGKAEVMDINGGVDLIDRFVRSRVHLHLVPLGGFEAAFVRDILEDIGREAPVLEVGTGHCRGAKLVAEDVAEIHTNRRAGFEGHTK